MRAVWRASRAALPRLGAAARPISELARPSGARAAALAARTASLGAPLRGPTLSVAAAQRRLSPRVAAAARTPSRRGLFIRTQETPNPNSLKFLPGRAVMGADGGTVDFQSVKHAQRSPLALRLFQVEGVVGVLFGADFVAVNVRDGTDWMTVKPEVFAAMSDFFQSGEALLKEEAVRSDTAITEGDDEVVAMIKEIIETRVRPTVQEDGGDIVYRGFDRATGKVKLQMQGSCVGCPSSSVTLRNGIENMLKHYVAEVEGVEEWKDEVAEQVSDEALRKLEARLAKEKEQAQAAAK